MEFPYQDMLELSHHVSQRHPPMPSGNRAAQFAPFAALDGYQEIIEETARATEPRRELAEDAQSILDARLALLKACQDELPQVEIEHFVSDAVKSGGHYVRTAGRLTKIVPDGRRLFLEDGTAIPIADIVALEGRILDKLDTMK